MLTVSLPISAPAQEAASSSAPGCPSGSAASPGPRLAAIRSRPRVHDQPPRVLVEVGLRPGRAAGRSARAGRGAARSAPGTRPAARRAARGRARTSPAWSAGRSPGPAGRAPRRRPSRARRTRRAGRRATASASPGSVWSVKYCHGVPAPHSSPMNSIGVNGAVRTRPGADLAAGPREQVGDPVARRPGCRPGRGPAGSRGSGAPGSRSTSTGRPWLRPRNADQRPVVEEHPGQGLGERRERAEVGVVALPLAGQGRVQRRDGSRRSTARPARTRPPRAGSPSAGRCGRTRRSGPAAGPAARRARPPRRRAPPGSAAARWSASACTASSRSPSRW